MASSSRTHSLRSVSSLSGSKQRAFARALALFHAAAKRVPAYKDFLKKNGVRPDSVQTAADFAHVPHTNKQDYISQYDLRALSWDGTLDSATYISSSSGSTGVPFFWPRGEDQDNTVGRMLQRIYEDIFEAREGTTLFVDSFALGSWIAGLEFFNSVRWAAEHKTHMTVVTPGIDKEAAVRQIKELAPLFSRTILAGYPPFVKDILDYGATNGIDWGAIDLKLFFGGEAVSETWKDKLLALFGKENDGFSRVVNIYGMAESGVVAHETPVTTLLRRNLSSLSTSVPNLPDPALVTGLYQYHPLTRYFEVTSEDSLLLTTNAGLPLVRYSTRDNGGLLDQNTCSNDACVALAKDAGVDLTSWRLPFVYLYGRKDLSISFYALLIYNENIKYAMEHSRLASFSTGFFTMHVGHTRNLDQRFELTIELAKGVRSSAQLKAALATDLAKHIATVNSEYAKLYSSICKRAEPRITLVPAGMLNTAPGRKHRWVV